MLSLLRISNYAIIDDIELELEPGFSVMTGETGAGKSILVDAIGLALGDRADASDVRGGARRAEISLVFELEPTHPAIAWLTERGLDDEEQCCLRRTISAEGRSRAYINNQPVTLKELRAVGIQLVDIHGQHAHQSLLRVSNQRRILDATADLEPLAEQVGTSYEQWQHAVREREALRNNSDAREAELELLRFQLDEIESLGLVEGEPAALSQESETLRHVDKLQQAVAGAAEALYESETGSAHALTVEARRLLETVLAHDPALAAVIERITSAEIEIKEAGSDLAHRLNRLEANPERLEEVETRLDRVRQLARRHRVAEDDVPGLVSQLSEKIGSLDSSAESLARLDTRCKAAEKRFFELARELSDARRAAGAALGRAVTVKLHELGLPHAEFLVRVESKPEGRADSTGTDQVSFAVTTNAGEAPGAIEKVASGGELSRIGLALATVATDASPIPTLIFDEVDAGIGGAIAEVVGRRLREIASRHQVLCVTHLPQVATQGLRQYRISKLSDGQTSRTQVRLLDDEQRIEELSRMLGGVEITETTRAHAEEMIRQAAGSDA